MKSCPSAGGRPGGLDQGGPLLPLTARQYRRCAHLAKPYGSLPARGGVGVLGRPTLRCASSIKRFSSSSCFRRLTAATWRCSCDCDGTGFSCFRNFTGRRWLYLPGVGVGVGVGAACATILARSTLAISAISATTSAFRRRATHPTFTVTASEDILMVDFATGTG